MHLFVIEFHVTNNNSLLLLSFIYYTSIFPLDKRSFREFPNTQAEKYSQSKRAEPKSQELSGREKQHKI